MKIIMYITGLLLCISGYSQNVGIGTANPVFGLDVRGGSINTDSLYRISTLPVLSIKGIQNLYVGTEAGKNNTSGNNNAFFGFSAGVNSTGSSNSFFGSRAGIFNVGFYNSFFGIDAGNSCTNGSYNSFFGSRAGFNTTGNNNAFFGMETGLFNTTGNLNSFYGNSAGTYNTTGSENSFFGAAAGYSNTTGNDNTFFGRQCGYLNTTGFWNSFFGAQAGFNNISGFSNSFFGQGSGFSNTTGNYNTLNGYQAGFDNTTGSSNSFFGFSAGTRTVTGVNNTAMGREALANNFSDNNTAIGYFASRTTTTGTQNTSIGGNSLLNNTSGSYHTSVGYNTGPTAVGLLNTTCIGIDASASANDIVRIGNIYVGSIGGYQSWSNISDGRYKKNVKENIPGLYFIMQLRPVTYTLDIDGINNSLGLKDNEIHASPAGIKTAYTTIHTGFIAQEVEKAARSIGYDFSGVDAPKNDKDNYGLRYAEFVVPLVKAVQEQQNVISELNKNAEQQNKTIISLQQQINELIKLVERSIK